MPLRVKIWFWRLAIVAAILAVWQISVDHSRLVEFFFGSPVNIARVIVQWVVSGVIFRHLAITLLETLLAFIIGTGLGMIFGLWFALDALLAAIFDPFIKALNSMPRLILAPIFAVWFGLGIWSKVALGVTLVFFVVFFNVFQGIKEVSPVVLANARMLGASDRQLIRRVYVPSAMTWVFSSLHLSVGLAFVGAVIGEYLGSSAGVGYLILQAEGSFDIETVYAGVVVLTIFALLLDYAITLAEARLLVWRPKTK
jgi:NitT/TauT family transport system permease protein